MSDIKRIPGYEDYGATRDGRIYSFKRDKFLALTETTNGYYKTTVSVFGRTKTWNVSRLIAITYLGLPEPGQQVRHIDGDKLNNNVDNLEWSTGESIMSLAMDSGRLPYKYLECEFLKDGQVIKVVNFYKFAKANGLDPKHLAKVANGEFPHHKGYSKYNPEQEVSAGDL